MKIRLLKIFLHLALEGDEGDEIIEGLGKVSCDSIEDIRTFLMKCTLAPRKESLQDKESPEIERNPKLKSTLLK
jgi:hypothetical protein